MVGVEGDFWMVGGRKYSIYYTLYVLHMYVVDGWLVCRSQDILGCWEVESRVMADLYGGKYWLAGMVGCLWHGRMGDRK